ncbi:hypothetical protein F7725_000555 [Dissostichus mawsoni]|uniref:CIDE-N domain-containing protein n=1 Tax=Dissostichus mawsoni TaxID=36200 RepID=A0A7J5ZFB0_DISMA|nr:hypothetical protein F7725_000555 [Dissostichus mawsoni]
MKQAGVRASKEQRQRQQQRLAATGIPVNHDGTHTPTVPPSLLSLYNCRSGPPPLARVGAKAVAPAPELRPPFATEERPHCVPGPADLGEEVSLWVSPAGPVSVVLEDDGTIVEDQAYFLCLPLNTKFMLLHERETWSPVRRMDGGTAWMARDSLVLDADTVDASSAIAPWWSLAQQLKQDLSSIILMSEAELQTLVDAPCPELASALGFKEKKAEDLQQTLQGVLDRREEERQSKELLQLYLKAAEKEEGQQEVKPGQPGRTLMVLKGKTSPETRLSTEDLQACEAELTGRLQQVQAVQSIRRNAQLDSGVHSGVHSAEEAAETPPQGSN